MSSWLRCVRLTALAAAFLAASCGQDATQPADPPKPEALVSTLQIVSGAGQHIWTTQRSPTPFRVRALDAAAKPVAGAEITFRVTGTGGGTPSQPHALTDSLGYAESWLMEAHAGTGTLVADAGGGHAELPFVVDRAVGAIRFLQGSGQAALPGLPHPDSVLAVRVLDTDGKPLAGQQVWFAGPGTLSQPADTTDADGHAETRLRRADMQAGAGDVYAFVLAFPNILAHDVRPIIAPAKRVVLVSVEGLRADALERWRAPHLQQMAREGAYAQTATTVSPALTAPAQLSMMSGVSPELHGILEDRLEFTPAMSSLDPVFKHASKQGRHAAAFISRDGPLAGFETALACRLAFGVDSLYLTPPDAGSVVDAASPALASGVFDLLFVDLPDPDLAGHRYGFTSPQYGAAVAAVDAAVGRLMTQLAGSPGTLLIVTSDHGGGGEWGDYQDGSDSPEDVQVPLLLWGARATTTRLSGVTILDVAPTMLWALGMAPPSSYQGRVLLEGFK